MPAAWRDRLAQLAGAGPEERLRLAIFAPGVWRRRGRLRTLLGPGTELQFGRLSGAHAVAGWGQKGQGRTRAEKAKLPYVALEDSFLSRLGGDDGPYGLMGLIADPVGIYYDAHGPSLCEELIAASAEKPADEEAEDLIAAMRRHGLGKFNRIEPAEPLDPQAERFDAIVVDQIAGDLSIPGGKADAGDYRRMLEAAFDENPGGRVAVKLHPYDGVGGRTGHLREIAARYGAEVLDNDRNWIRCAQNADRVYVVSSNAGLEALIAGAKVSCFGVPFFAGWGLTDDRQQTERRTARPSLEQMVGAVYGAYGLSFLPSLARQGSALELARFIAAQQRHQKKLSGLKIAGMQRLKASHVRPFAGPLGKPVRVVPSPTADAPAIWSSRCAKDPAVEKLWSARERHYVEDGFVRSVGLGADLVRPCSLVFDSRGIYYDPSRPSDLEHLLATYDLAPDERRRGEELRKRLHGSKVTKYNLSSNVPEIDTEGRKVIIVPGQVENDASIIKGAGRVRTNAGLLEAVRAANPDAYILYKPHPDVADAGRPGHVANADELADVILEKVGAAEAIGLADEVHTMTSLMGFEALIRGKAVTTYGLPFYAGWRLTDDQLTCERRGRRREIDELVFLALIAYPYYISPLNGLPATGESTIEALSRSVPGAPAVPGARQALRLWRKARTLPDYLRR